MPKKYRRRHGIEKKGHTICTQSAQKIFMQMGMGRRRARRAASRVCRKPPGRESRLKAMDEEMQYWDARRSSR